jgi:hypothetical protein
MYFLKKVGLNKLSLFVALIFWEGIFRYFNPALLNVYKILMVAYALSFYIKNKSKASGKYDYYINVSFLIFSMSFFISYYFTGGKLTTILSQFFFRFGMVFFIYHGFKELYYNDSKRHYVKNMLLLVIYIQVFLSIVKILIYPFPLEKIVGSMAASGGGLAVIFPIVAFIFYWVIKDKNLKNKDWLIIASIFLVAIASGKRAPVILFPIFMFLIANFTKSRSINIVKMVKYIPLILIIFYLGTRLIPTLNPDRKVWGSFSAGYVIDYAFKYKFGTADIKEIMSYDYETTGEGGSLLLIFQPEKLYLYSLTDKLFGKGLYKLIYEHGHSNLGEEDLRFEHTGRLSNINIQIWSLGYSGLLSMLLFALVYIYAIRDKQIRFLVLFLFLYDFIFYQNMVVFSNQSAIMLTFICIYANAKMMRAVSDSPTRQRNLSFT